MTWGAPLVTRKVVPSAAVPSVVVPSVVVPSVVVTVASVRLCTGSNGWKCSIR